MNSKFCSTLFFSATLFAVQGVLANPAGADGDGKPAVVDKVEKAVEHGAQATADGIRRGAKATANGIQRGAKATARGIQHGAEATENAAHHVAEKLGVKADNKQ